MHHTANLLRTFLLHDPQGVCRGIPGMDNERLAGLPGRAYVCTKALSLPLCITLDPVIVQAGFPDGDNPAVTSQSDQSGDVRLLAGSLIRVHADRCKYIGKALRA